jgi:hypothetical protein
VLLHGYAKGRPPDMDGPEIDVTTKDETTSAPEAAMTLHDPRAQPSEAGDAASLAPAAPDPASAFASASAATATASAAVAATSALLATPPP